MEIFQKKPDEATLTLFKKYLNKYIHTLYKIIFLTVFNYLFNRRLPVLFAPQAIQDTTHK